ncbi:MAG: 2-oxoacid:ferredoxin oxidoreductase subunit beta [Myxococcales bacterium]|nr:2-oxoacid:ferredoxin oxidoreductase subunit beta [Myxococcales bacterium]MCB9577665.1 2-oxoacid:ferredoxin oxidoreductase subunit beta [Polyangiaceae bacterium]
MSNVIQTEKLTKKDFATDQDVRWCPGCGDYSILANVQKVMPELGVARENIVFVSGIGCSSRFPYYMNTYGFHTIHGRAPAIAMGVKVANPDLSVWIVTGDGDGLSIGGNHLMHCLRRNLDVNILMFNNRIYGLTKGQYSPTSEFGKVTKSSPTGSADFPVDPCTFAIGCSGSFVARSIDTDAGHLSDMIRRAAQHTGASFIEIYQNCNVFNDGAFDAFRDKANMADALLRVEHEKPLLFGKEKNKGLRIDPRTFGLEVVTLGENGITEKDIIVHDETNATLAYMLARMPFPKFPVTVGVLYASDRPTYDATVTSQREATQKKLGKGSLEKLLNSGNTWTV